MKADNHNSHNPEEVRKIEDVEMLPSYWGQAGEEHGDHNQARDAARKDERCSPCPESGGIPWPDFGVDIGWVKHREDVSKHDLIPVVECNPRGVQRGMGDDQPEQNVGEAHVKRVRRGG